VGSCSTCSKGFIPFCGISSTLVKTAVVMLAAMLLVMLVAMLQVMTGAAMLLVDDGNDYPEAPP
jgi:hypothetical protein